MSVGITSAVLRGRRFVRRREETAKIKIKSSVPSTTGCTIRATRTSVRRLPSAAASASRPMTTANSAGSASG